MTKKRSFPIILIFASALLAALPMTFPSLGLLCFVSFVPLFVELLLFGEKRSWGKTALAGLFFGFCYHALIYFWFLWLYPLSFAGFSNAASLALVLLAWLGISLLHGALFVIPPLLYRFTIAFSRSRGLALFSSMLGVLAAQKIQGLSQLAFPWARVSLGLYRFPVFIQLASVFGIIGVDLLLLGISAFVSLALVTGKGRGRLGFSLCAAALFLLNLGFGAFALAQEEVGETISISLVQGSVMSGEKWDGNSALSTYLTLTQEISETDLVVWPESAVPTNLATSPGLLEELQDLSRQIDAPIFLGCFWKKEGQSTNSALYLDGASLSPVYSKRVLVPFGERMPYRAVLSRLFPFLGEINMLSEDLASGEGPVVMETDVGNLGGVICYESLFPGLYRDSVADGAQLFVLVTNDSWYKDSPAVWQHLAHSVFRSVENGRDTARCANSGVSALIDGKGRILRELGPLKKGILTGEVTLQTAKTRYSTWGEVAFPACSAAYLCLFALTTWKERRKARGSRDDHPGRGD